LDEACHQAGKGSTRRRDRSGQARIAGKALDENQPVGKPFRRAGKTFG
jgi:hypothetical protein